MIWTKWATIHALREIMPQRDWWYVYDLKKTIDARWAAIYRALGELELTGFVVAKWDDLEPGHKYRRRLYRWQEPPESKAQEGARA